MNTELRWSSSALCDSVKMLYISPVCNAQCGTNIIKCKNQNFFMGDSNEGKINNIFNEEYYGGSVRIGTNPLKITIFLH